MQAQTRTNQGGSVINFLIVGVILAAVALGAIFFAQQRGKDVATEPKPPVATSPSPSASPSSTPQLPSSSPRPSAQPSSSPAATPSPAVVPQTGVMPQTGPAKDTLLTILPIILLTMALVSYIQSRKATS